MNELQETAEVKGWNAENIKEIDKLVCEADKYITDKIDDKDSYEKEN